jgi:hypothetical protein
MVGFSLQFFAVAAIGITLLLAVYAAYVRIKSRTYTEKRFHFVALWACTSVVFMAAFSVTDIQIFSIALKLFGIDLQIATLPEKALIIFLAGSYCYVVRNWALQWTGLLTEEGKKNKDRERHKGILIDGLSETIRIVRGQPPSKLSEQSSSESRRLALSTPINELPFSEQVRILILAKWPEYEIVEDSWAGGISCWQGLDRAFDRPILVACGINSTEFDFSALAELAKIQANPRGVLVICVFQIKSTNADHFQNVFQRDFDAKFISFDELAQTVANFDEYRRFIRLEFEQKPLPDADFAIADVLAPTRVRLSSSRNSQRDDEVTTIDFEKLVTNWVTERSDRQLALLGEYGQGKSTAALALTYKLLFQPDFANRCDNRIPILVRLTGRSPSTTRLGELLGAWGAQYNLSGQVLLSLHKAGRLLLIFDAFDEMAHVMDRTARFEHFDALWEFASYDAKILFTGRPNFFLDDEELKEVLGIAKSTAVGPYCEAFSVVPFDLEQIERAIGWLPDEKKRILVDATKRSPALQEVCCRPSLLYLIAHLWNRNRLDLRDENVRSASVVLEFISYSLERQVQKQQTEAASRRPERQFISVTKNELGYFTSGIAVSVLTEGRQNSIARDIFEMRIEELYQRISSVKLPAGTDEVGGLALPITQRFIDLAKPIEACANAVRTHGVIEHDFTRPRHYRFSHKSFAEVLASQVLTNKLLSDDEISAAIEAANSCSIIELAQQPQILEFLADFLAKDSQTRKIEYEDIYKRIFPSKIELVPYTRLRSIATSLVFFVHAQRTVRLAMLFSFVICSTLFLATFFTQQLARTKPNLSSLAAFEQITVETPLLGVMSVSVIIMMLFIVFSLLFADRSLHRFALLDRLCSLLEKKGFPIKRTSLEKAAQRLATRRAM